MTDFDILNYELRSVPTEEGLRALKSLARLREIVDGMGSGPVSGPVVCVTIDERGEDDSGRTPSHPRPNVGSVRLPRSSL